jgi:hypothetical protein
MIFRALLGLMLLWLLIPREPDIGFGRPGFDFIRDQACETHGGRVSTFSASVSRQRDDHWGFGIRIRCA